MEVGCLVISHKKANVERIEKIWTGDYSSLSKRILSSPLVCECAFLTTCNRFEIYVAGNDVEKFLHRMSEKLGVADVAEIYTGERCLEHILRVASGLESMMVGENQILGQVRQFHNLCKELHCTGKFLDRIFSKAVQVGRRVRKETGIARGSVSIGSAAVELAEGILGDLKGKKVLLVGAGEMGTLVAKAIANKDVEAVLIANRTYARAEELAKKIGGIAVRFDRLEEYLKQCDIVISATSAPHIVISEDVVRKAMEERENLILIDIALPRDIDESVKRIKGVSLFTIDDLREISERNLRGRLHEVTKAEKIVKEEVEQLQLLLKDIKASIAIASMYSSAEKYKREEIEELYSKLSAKYDVGEDVREMLEDFANSLIKKFLRMPTVRLREAARNGRPYVIDAIEYLFGDEDVSETSDEKVEKRYPETDFQRGKIRQG
jgi:glutamyl-tRNA reductase